MSEGRAKTFEELLSELERATQQAHKLAAQTQAPLEDELRTQLTERAKSARRDDEDA